MSNRLALPAEFYDITSARMLKQPEPQYLYAQLLYLTVRDAEMKRAERLGLTPERAIAPTGAPMPPFSENQLVLSEAAQIYAEAIMTTDELVPGTIGHTVRFNRPKFVNSTYTKASRLIGPNATIGTTPITSQDEQTSLTIQRYAGPYDGSAVNPYAIDKLDSERAVHSLGDRIGLDLYRDRTKWVDTVLATDFALASTATVYPNDPASALSTDASAFITNFDRPMNFEAITRCDQKLREANIPTFANGKYILFMTPQQDKQARNDPRVQRMATFLDDKNPLNAQHFVLGGVDCYSVNTNVTDATTVSGVTIHKAVMFGPGYYGYASAGPCTVEVSSNDNYGQTVLAIWIAREGFGVLDSRFGAIIKSD